MELSGISLRDALNAAPDPTVIVDSDGIIVFASDRVVSVLGYTPEQLTGQPVETLVPERFRTAHRRHRRGFAAWPSGRPMGESLQLVARRQDGGEVPVEVSLTPLNTDQGALVLSTIRDVSDREAARSLVLRERAFLDSLIQTAPTIVLLLDVEGRVERINPYFEHLSGYRADEVVGKDWFETFLPAADRAKIRELFARIIEAGHNPGHVNPIVTREGRERQIEWLAKTLLDEHGRVIGLLNIGHDVTRQREHEAALERTSEEAEQANASKSRFLAAASHDLRQPLQSLGLYLSVLSRLLDEPKPLEVCGKMRKSLDTMGELLNALLDISKLDSGSVVPEKADVALELLFDRIVTDNVQQAEEKGLALICEGTAAVVHSDPALLQRVIENLVTNAIRYTDRGEVRIDCECGDGLARVRVSDTGIGIPEESLEKIFDEYYQLDNPARDRRKGLGLGLSIVRHIARLLDLNLTVESVPGEGSTFTVEVPLGTAAREPEPAAVPAARGGRSRPVVLLVEDDPTVVDATIMLLGEAGVGVQHAEDGPAALERIRQGLRPDLVVCDYWLSGMNGAEVIRAIQEQLGVDVPAVLMTGDTGSREIHSGRPARFTVLHKPVQTEQLLRLLETSLGLDSASA